jgi:hypothetical protein
MLTEQRPIVALEPSFRDSLKLKEQLIPGHLPLPQRGWGKRMRAAFCFLLSIAKSFAAYRRTS